MAMAAGFPFDRATEQDVRERIIWPLLVRLGFSDEMVTTERPLVYTRLFLGRKKGEKDRPLRGRADYVCDVDGRLRLVIDAKEPGEITQDDREQTYSYAVHPEIRAVTFAVISGSHFEVYHTFFQPERGPLLAFTYDQLEENFQKLANIVSPGALRRDFPDYQVDIGVPLGPGLRSFAKVVRGIQTYTEVPETMASRLGSSVHYIDGSLLRDAGRVLLHLVPSHAAPADQEFARVANITELELVSDAETISADPASPTVFRSVHQFAIAEGAPVPVPALFNVTTPAPASVSFRGVAEYHAYLDGTVLRGKVVAGPVNESGQLLFRVVADIELVLI